MTPPSRPRRAWSIRAHLVALVAAVALPLLGLNVWAGVREYRQARVVAGDQALAIADATSASTAQFFATVRGVVRGVAEQLGPGALASGSCEALVQNIDDALDFVVNFMVAGPEGNVLCASRSFPDERPNITEWSWYDRMIRTRGPVISEPLEGTISGTWVVSVAAPIPGPDGTVSGAMIGSVPLLQLEGLITGFSAAGDALVTIVAGDVVAARSRDPAQYVGRPAPPAPGNEREVAPGRWIATGADFEGVERAWGRTAIPELGWRVFVGVPEADVVGPVVAGAVRRGVITLLAVLAGGVLAGLVYRRVSGALAQLVDGTKAARSGQEVRLPADAPEEVAAVADQLNRTLEARRQAEEAARRMRERHTSIFDNAVFGICVTTEDGRFLEVNPALVSMLGYPSAEALLSAGSRALYANPAERERLLAAHRDAKRIDDVETEWIRADGTTIAVRLNGSVMRLDDGSLAFETIVQDITDERRREDELRQTQKMEAVGRLAGGIAHDFNNLLTVIDGNLQLLIERLQPGTPSRTEATNAAEAVERATALTRQLLSFSRKDVRKLGVVDLNEVVAPLDRMLGRLLGERVTLRTELGTGPLVVEADPGQLEQVVMNLVINARDALPEGGGITLGTRRTRERGGEREGVLLTVSDDGVGMDEQTRTRIFEPFFTTKREGEGTGLGLSTVYGIVRTFGGTIGVESSPGAGTTFDIWLPAAGAPSEPAPTPPAPAPRPAATDGGLETILVVDDEPMVGDIVLRTLVAAGFTVHRASSGEEALAVARELGDLDLVLTDVVMPGMNGPALAGRLERERPGLPVLYMSGYTHNLLGQGGQDVAYEVVEKPFRPGDLVARVRKVLDQARADGEPGAS